VYFVSTEQICGAL